MNFDQVKIKIRPRSHLEALDLSVALVRQHWMGLGLAALFGAGPFLALNLYIFRPSRFIENPAVSYFFIIALAMEIPWATSFITIYLGQATFLDRISARTIIADFFRSIWQMIVFQTLLRGVLMYIPVVNLFAFFGYRYLNEIILLEKNRMGKTWKRSSSFHSSIFGKNLGESLVDLFFSFVIIFVLTMTLQQLQELWMSQYSMPYDEPEWGGVFTWNAQLAVWLVVCFFAVVRFVVYLDCRIRREGWDIALKLRSQVAELKLRETF